MPVSEMLERLERAQAEIRAVEESLNDNAHPCAACGLTIREDFTQHQMRIQLAATRNKLNRFVGSLRSRASSACTSAE
jgi:cytidine deaminase